MRRELRALVLVLVALLAVVVAAVPMLSASAAEDPDPDGVPGTAFEVEDALLRWGVNNESNNRAAAPGTFNLFSAGHLADPGEGGQALTDASAGARWANGKPAGWTAVEDNVRIEKRQPDGSYATATWAGTRTDRDGAVLGGYGSNTKFSDHQVVLAGGTGEVDPAAGKATIRWTGEFTIAYYSGYTITYVSDPVLTVTGGVGKVTATLGGYTSSRDDVSQWVPAAPRPGVVIADLGTVDLGRALGFTVTPKYRGVRIDLSDQVTSGEYWGSFPQSFIDFQRVAGAAAYWFSSGGAVDRNKVPLPLAVSYAAGAPIIPETPGNGGSENPPVDNSAPPPPPRPTPTPTPSSAPSAPVVQPPGPALPAQPVAVAPESGAVADPRPVATVLPAAARTTAASASASRAPWVAGFVLLGLAALTAVAPSTYRWARGG